MLPVCPALAWLGARLNVDNRMIAGSVFVVGLVSFIAIRRAYTQDGPIAASPSP